MNIMCAMCGKPVDRVEWFDDPMNFQRVIRAHCHGKVDEMRLDSNQPVHIFKALRDARGVAFAGKEKLPC